MNNKKFIKGLFLMITALLVAAFCPLSVQTANAAPQDEYLYHYYRHRLPCAHLDARPCIPHGCGMAECGL